MMTVTAKNSAAAFVWAIVSSRICRRHVGNRFHAAQGENDADKGLPRLDEPFSRPVQMGRGQIRSAQSDDGHDDDQRRYRHPDRENAAMFRAEIVHDSEERDSDHRGEGDIFSRNTEVTHARPATESCSHEKIRDEQCTDRRVLVGFEYGNSERRAKRSRVLQIVGLVPT
jgi:hypothetical protein